MKHDFITTDTIYEYMIIEVMQRCKNHLYKSAIYSRKSHWNNKGKKKKKKTQIQMNPFYSITPA